MNKDLKSIVNTVGDLPPMPAVAVKVMQLLQDPNSTAQSLAGAIALDPAVSARVLKIANSSFYGMSRQITTLKTAIVVLGDKTLRSMVLAVSLKGLNKRFGLVEKMLWEDSVGCAIAARLASMKFQSAEREEAFMAGLFRHIGLVVWNNNFQEQFRDLTQAIYNGEGTPSALEKEFFPHSHAEVGAALLEKWNFAHNFIKSTLHHEDLALDPKEEPAAYRLAATINLAGALCRRLGIGKREPEEGLEVAEVPGALALGIEPEAIYELLEEFQIVFEENRDFFFA